MSNKDFDKETTSNGKDDGKEFIKKFIRKLGTINGASIGGAAASAATGAAASAVTAAAAGTGTSLTVGAGFAPFVTALGAAKLASLPGIVLFLANPVGAVVATGVFAMGGAIAGYKIAKFIGKKL
jgi:hypothetical protein